MTHWPEMQPREAKHMARAVRRRYCIQEMGTYGKAASVVSLDAVPKRVKIKAEEIRMEAKTLQIIVNSRVPEPMVINHQFLICLQKIAPISVDVASDMMMAAH